MSTPLSSHLPTGVRSRSSSVALSYCLLRRRQTGASPQESRRAGVPGCGRACVAQAVCIAEGGEGGGRGD